MVLFACFNTGICNAKIIIDVELYLSLVKKILKILLYDGSSIVGCKASFTCNFTHFKIGFAFNVLLLMFFLDL